MISRLQTHFVALLEWAFGWRIYTHIETHPYTSSPQELASELEDSDGDVVQLETSSPNVGRYLTYDFRVDTFERPIGLDEKQSVVVIRG